jgi:hypothetical protein
MASGGMGDILKYGLLAGAGYLIYQNFFATPAAATTAPAPAAGGGTPPAPPAPPAPPPPVPPGYTYVPPTLAAALAGANSSGSASLNADQWAYYWNNGLKKPAIDPGVFTALFFPSGRPADPSQAPQMTAAQFVAALGSKGVSGLGAVVIRPPLVVRRGGKLLVWRQA